MRKNFRSYFALLFVMVFTLIAGGCGGGGGGDGGSTGGSGGSGGTPVDDPINGAWQLTSGSMTVKSGGEIFKDATLSVDQSLYLPVEMTVKESGGSYGIFLSGFNVDDTDYEWGMYLVEWDTPNYVTSTEVLHFGGSGGYTQIGPGLYQLTVENNVTYSVSGSSLQIVIDGPYNTVTYNLTKVN